MSRRRLLYLTLFLVALAVRLAVAFAVGDLEDPVTFEWGEVAEGLLAGRGFECQMWWIELQTSASKPPLFPMILAGFLAVFGSQGYLALILTQCLASALACVVAVSVGRLFFDFAPAFLGGFFLAFYPQKVYFVQNIQHQSFSFLLFMGIAYLTARLYLVRHSRDEALTGNAPSSASPLRYCLGLGALFGVALLYDPSLCAVMPVSLLGAFLAGRSAGTARQFLAPAIVVGLALLILSPWTIRNYVVLGEFIPVRSDLGLNLYLGNFEHATGTLRTAEGEVLYLEIPEEEREYYKDKPIWYVNQVYEEKAREYMAEHKMLTLQRTLYKAFYFYWPFEPAKYHYLGPDNPGRFPLFRQISWAIPFFLGLAGLVLLFRKRSRMPVEERRRRASPWILVAMFLLFPLTYIITVIGYRYRLVVDPFFVLLMGYSVWWVLVRVRPGMVKWTGE